MMQKSTNLSCFYCCIS